MGYCDRCGTLLAGDSSGLCITCASSSAHGSGTPTDVPCQRCGMYLPPHELRMWNSRLYCAYCIMDVMDDEKRMHDLHREQRRPAEEPMPSGKPEEDALHIRASCDLCGRAAGQFYHSHGRRLCQRCYSESESQVTGGGALGGVHQVAVGAKEGIRAKVLPLNAQSGRDERDKKSGFGALIERIKRRLSRKKE